MTEKITGASPSFEFKSSYGGKTHIDRSDLKLEDLLVYFYGNTERAKDAIALAKKQRKPSRNYIATAQLSTKYCETVRFGKAKFLAALDKEMQGWTRASTMGSNFVYNVGRNPDAYQAKKYKKVWFVPNSIADQYRTRLEAA